jgi:1-acyl-sn-glycerol-3-phosphate acyltransferase
MRLAAPTVNASRAPHEAVYRAAIGLGSGLFRALDLRRDVHGVANVPPSGPAILAITHFGYLDFALVQDAVWRHHRRLTRFLVTDAAFGHRLAGPLLRAMRHIPVHRAAGAGAYRMTRRAVRRGELVGIFPESAVSVTNELLPLKKGAAALAVETGAPLIPVLVWGGQRVISKGIPMKWGRARHADIHIEFAPPIRPEADSDPVAVTAELRAALTVMIARMLEVAPERSHVHCLAGGRPPDSRPRGVLQWQANRRGRQPSARTSSRKTAASTSAASEAASPVKRRASSGPSARTTSASASSRRPSSSSTETASA